MVHKIEDDEGIRYVISSHSCWRPGAYDSEETARFAFQFPDEVLQRLQTEANARAGGVIVRDALVAAKRLIR